ncbi:MAG: HAD-IIA family hydrolase [Anaerolineales bacterium]|nr:MAG: HAD-IIA family hydrolase [Anaerolineales bacterium]
MPKLTDITHLIIDMDGVLYQGDKPVLGLHEFFSFLRERPIPFILATNNSTRTPQQRVEKLARMGVQIFPEEVLTSGQATARVLAREYPAGTRVHVFGSPALRKAVEEEGFVLADEDVELVVASMDRDVTYEKLKRAALLIRGGARFVATNLDPTQPTAEGLLPGTGSLIAALRTTTETEPLVIGKPEPTMFQLAMAKMGAKPETTATIGDRLDTDILGGQRAGLITICVLSGSTSSRAEAETFGPDFIFQDIAELVETWQSL